MLLLKEICAYLEIPYFIILCVSLFLILFFLRNKVGYFLLSAIGFLFVWRIFFRINASRYNASFLPLLFVMASILIVKGCSLCSCLRGYLLFGMIALLLFNILKAFGGFRNLYIVDVTEDMNIFYQDDPLSTVFIMEKEFRRIRKKDSTKGFEQFPINGLDKTENIKAFLYSYSKYGEDIYIVYSGIPIDFFLSNPQKNYPITKIRNYYTNSKKTRNVSVYKYEVEKLDYIASPYDLQTNLIKNGNCEILQSQEEKIRTFKTWIEAGDSFLSSEHTIIPKFSILLPEYKTFLKSPAFPKVFAEEKDPISGKYSLHLDFKNGEKYIYLFNHLPPVEGILSFSIRSLTKDTSIKLLIQGYINGKAKVPENSLFFFSLKDDKVHTFQIRVDKTMLCGNKIIFCLFANETVFLIDDVSYSPLP